MTNASRFKKLVPFGLFWGFATGFIVHFIGAGGTGSSYWIIFVIVWTLAGLLWAYLLARFTKSKSNSNSTDGKEVL